ncbi:MAG: hypothetical protein HUU21_27725 [Polyangiaceae bacterium]|nr:hypothetical protein [Polyangiaceae bacterium]NUQ77343.1 hypothetical protein [Polyangiaceae bacterium]
MTTPEAKRARTLLLVTALACFGLGLAVAGIFAAADGAKDAPSPSASSPHVPDAAFFEDAGAPKIFFDPSSISLLPDASLRIELPEGWDAGVTP